MKSDSRDISSIGCLGAIVALIVFGLLQWFLKQLLRAIWPSSLNPELFVVLFGALAAIGILFAYMFASGELEIKKIRRQRRERNWRSLAGDADAPIIIPYRRRALIVLLVLTLAGSAAGLFICVVGALQHDSLVGAAVIISGGSWSLVAGSLASWCVARLLLRDPAIVFDSTGISHAAFYSRPRRITWDEIVDAELVRQTVDEAGIVTVRNLVLELEKRAGWWRPRRRFRLSPLLADTSSSELRRILARYRPEIRPRSRD